MASNPSNPAKSPPLTTSLLFFPSLEPVTAVGPTLVVGVGPVLLTTVVPVIVVAPPPGNCATQLGLFVHEYGPWPPLQVVFCPEQVHVAGQVVRVVIVVAVVVNVELLYGGVVGEEGEEG